MDDIVVMAIAESLEDLPHVVAEGREKNFYKWRDGHRKEMVKCALCYHQVTVVTLVKG